MILERLFCVKDFLTDLKLIKIDSHPRAAAHPKKHKDRGEHCQTQRSVKDRWLSPAFVGRICGEEIHPEESCYKAQGHKEGGNDR
jgi:hypothetical protein